MEDGVKSRDIGRNVGSKQKVILWGGERGGALHDQI
jgi:hypothetical protein